MAYGAGADTGEWSVTEEWPPVTDEWRRVAAGARRVDDTGEWTYLPEMHDRLAETGQGSVAGPWHRITDTGEWSRGDLADLERDPDPATCDIAAGDGSGYDGHLASETFWEGTRLAGDDPRWMATPASAPQSPAIYHSPAASCPDLSPTDPDLMPPDRPLTEPGLPAVDPMAAPIVEADPLAWHPDHRHRKVDRGGLLATMLCAAAWYVVPLLVLFVWMLTLDGSAPARCVTDAAGRGCESPQAEAAASIVAAAPQFGAALTASIMVAMLLHRISSVWRTATVGLVAAVIGGGLSTVLFQLVANQVG